MLNIWTEKSGYTFGTIQEGAIVNLPLPTNNNSPQFKVISGAIVDSAQLDIQTSAANANIVFTPNGTGNVNMTTGLSVTGNITGGNIMGGANVNATTHTGTTASLSGNVTGGNILTGGLVSATGTITGAADLAENYSADAEYAPGTVLVFGGNNEVTISTVSADSRVAGVISTNPAHLMNSTLEAEHVAAVALTGRVPTKVVGTIRKGDMMVTAGNGHAQASAAPAVGTVIGKALQDFDGDSGTIEIVVGRV